MRTSIPARSDRRSERGFTPGFRSAEHGFTSRVRPAEHGFESLRRSAEHGFTPRVRSAEHGFTPRVRSAEHGFTPRVRTAEHGFTLVELMVVITIIGLVSAAVVIAMPDPRGRLVDDADRFAVRLAAARDAAVISARPVSVWVSPGGYGFERRDGDRWVPMEEKPFVTTKWASGVGADTGDAAQLRINFDSIGMTGDERRFMLRREGESVAVGVEPSGKIKVGN